MTWYAARGPLRTRQLLLGLSVALWVVVWLRRAGGSRRRALRGAGDRCGAGADVPLLGDGLRSPLDLAATAGDALARAGTAQQDAVGTLALVLALLLSGLPVG